MKRVILIMGVSGSGKTTIGRMLAQKLQAQFLEGDDFHSAENQTKMSKGIPLTDFDRMPWLKDIKAALLASRSPLTVLACSALKESYRTQLLSPTDYKIEIGHLFAEKSVLKQRIETRLSENSHFMSANLLDSQLETLEAPGHVLEVDSTLPVDEILSIIIKHFNFI